MMTPTIKTLFVIAMLVTITQTVNLGYLKWFTERYHKVEIIEDEAAKKEAAERAAYALKEENSRIKELNYYCLWGLLFVVFGIVVFNKLNALLGLSFMIAGFCELFGYTGVLIRFPHTDYSRLMTAKFSYSLASSALLLVTAYAIGILKGNDDAATKIVE